MAESTITQIDEDIEVGYIDETNLDSFKTLLMPDVAAAIESGEPVVALGLVMSGVAAGAVAGHAEDETFVIESLYVAPAYRKRGGGEKLMDELTDLLWGEVSQIRIGLVITLPEHEELAAFLNRNGFVDIAKEDSSMFRITLRKLTENEMLNKVPDSPKVLNFADVDEYLLRKEHKRAMAAGDPVPFGSFVSPSVRKDLSAAYVEGDEVMGYLVIEEPEPGVLSVSSALNRGNAKVFTLVLKKALDNLKANFEPETVLMVPVINSVSAGIVKKLDPDAGLVYRLLEKTL